MLLYTEAQIRFRRVDEIDLLKNTGVKHALNALLGILLFDIPRGAGEVLFARVVYIFIDILLQCIFLYYISHTYYCEHVIARPPAYT